MINKKCLIFFFCLKMNNFTINFVFNDKFIKIINKTWVINEYVAAPITKILCIREIKGKKVNCLYECK
jgi:hypothetical protein